MQNNYTVLNCTTLLVVLQTVQCIHTFNVCLYWMFISLSESESVSKNPVFILPFNFSIRTDNTLVLHSSIIALLIYFIFVWFYYCYFIFIFQAPEPTDPVNYHFVAFVHKDGSLFELGMLITVGFLCYLCVYLPDVVMFLCIVVNAVSEF